MKCAHCKQVLVYDPPSGQNLPKWNGDYGVMCPVLTKKNERPTFCEQAPIHPKWETQPYPNHEPFARPEYNWPEPPTSFSEPLPETLTDDPDQLRKICAKLREEIEAAESRCASARAEAQMRLETCWYGTGK